MAITQAYSGSASISTTEISLVSGTTTLQSIADPAVIQVFISATGMVAGDEYLLKIKDKVTSGSAQNIVYQSVISNKQPEIIVTPTLILYHGWDVTMDLITGVASTITWSLRKVG